MFARGAVLVMRARTLVASGLVIGGLLWFVTCRSDDHATTPSAATPHASTAKEQRRSVVTGQQQRPSLTEWSNPTIQKDRDARWSSRMTELDRRARAELGFDDATAAEIMVLQANLREAKHAIRSDMMNDEVDYDAGAESMRREMTRFRVQLAHRLGRDKARQYFDLERDVKAKEQR